MNNIIHTVNNNVRTVNNIIHTVNETFVFDEINFVWLRFPLYIAAFLTLCGCEFINVLKKRDFCATELNLIRNFVFKLSVITNFLYCFVVFLW